MPQLPNECGWHTLSLSREFIHVLWLDKSPRQGIEILIIFKNSIYSEPFFKWKELFKIYNYFISDLVQSSLGGRVK